MRFNATGRNANCMGAVACGTAAGPGTLVYRDVPCPNNTLTENMRVASSHYSGTYECTLGHAYLAEQIKTIGE